MSRKSKRSSRRPGVTGTAGGTTAAASPPPSSPWILDKWRDLILFVATPALILPLFGLARRQWSVQEIYLFVAAFGALGHHLPGMLRAYGDRDLFRRFRARFIAAPVFLGAVCALFAVREMGTMVLIATVWGIWHGMAQTYGFVRIYDAKKQSFSKLTARLDRAMCVSWFGAGILLSPGRLNDLLDRLYRQVGIPFLPEGFVPTLRDTWMLATAAITVGFVLHSIRAWKEGHPPSPIKLLLMVTSFGFWFIACIAVDDMLVGVALFEVFHDVQYLSIVWIYNRNRVRQDREGGTRALGDFMTFLFRRSGALIGLYVGLVFAYGSLSYVSRGLPVEPLKGSLQGLLVASALLHFYYDGFIWRVRESSTAKSLGLGASGRGGGPTGLPMWTRHAIYWAIFVGVIGWLGFTEARTMAVGRSSLEVGEALVSAVPESGAAHFVLAKALADRGRHEEAIRSYRSSLELRPEDATTHYELSRSLAELGDHRAEVEHLEEALRLDPEYAEAHNDLSLVYAERGEFERELYHLREALRIQPSYAEAHNNLGVAYASRGRMDRALGHFEEAVRLQPDDAGSHNNLGLALAGSGDLTGAIEHFRRALEIDPELTAAREALDSAQRRLQNPPTSPVARASKGNEP